MTVLGQAHVLSSPPRGWSAWSGTALLLALLLVGSPRTEAQKGDSSPESSPATTAPVDGQPGVVSDSQPELLQHMIDAYQRQDWVEARAWMQRAHALRPTARTWRGLGILAFESGQYVQAIWELERSLSDPVDPLTARMQQDANWRIAQAESHVASFRIATSPREAGLSLDGEPPRLRLDGRILMRPGPHTLRVDSEGHRPEVLELLARAGEDRDLSITLQPWQERPEVADATSEAGPEPPSPDGSRRMRRTGWATGGAALALGLVAGTLQLRARSQHEALVGACMAACSPDDPAADTTRRDRLVTSSRVFVGLAAGAALSAVGLLITAKLRRGGTAPDRSDTGRVRLEGLSLRGSF